jgi:hypothetical protein
MKRPKDPNDKDKAGDEQSPPGGRARERVDMFNRQRGIPADSGSTSEKNVEDSKDSTSDKKKN